jgi:hypothetical protein
LTILLLAAVAVVAINMVVAVVQVVCFKEQDIQ